MAYPNTPPRRLTTAFAQNAPEGTTADRAEIADSDTATNVVNYSTGYTARYALQYGINPQALPVERQFFNGILYDVTASIKDWQDYGFPVWQNGTYYQGAMVRYNPNGFKPPYTLYHCIAPNGTNLAPTNDGVNWEYVPSIGQLTQLPALVNRFPDTSTVPVGRDFNDTPNPITNNASGIIEFISDGLASSWTNAPLGSATMAGVLEEYKYPYNTVMNWIYQRYSQRDGTIYIRNFDPSVPQWTPWAPINASLIPTGGNKDKIFYLNQQTVTANYSVPTGNNAMTAGPITVNTGVIVTVPTGSTWTVV